MLENEVLWWIHDILTMWLMIKIVSAANKQLDSIVTNCLTAVANMTVDLLVPGVSLSRQSAVLYTPPSR